MANRMIEKTAIDTIRTLSMDAIQAANSGHPGAPMALAPVAYCLWQRFLRFDPSQPLWMNRDRFVLSNGHASMLLYSLLHLSGVKAVGKTGTALDEPAVSLDAIKAFRQLEGKCPGHPEFGWTGGVETTTGPLGQGFANSVGMAMAGRWFAGRYNQENFQLFNYRVFALGGDGCMMEGVSAEAASLAGHLKLSNLCWIYDSNHITIEGSTQLAMSENTASRFESYGWEVRHVADANNLMELTVAFDEFEKGLEKPLLIIVNSHIAYGSPNKQDTADAHGSPLGPEEIKITKRNYNWPEDSQFFVPDSVMQHFASGIGERGLSLRTQWETVRREYARTYPEKHTELDLMQSGELPEGWDLDIPVFQPDPKGIATRVASGKILNAIAPRIPWLVGGSADLAPSTKTYLNFNEAGVLTGETPSGRNIHFGIREHAMGAIMNGLAVSKLRPFGSTFLVFSDYMRPPIRLSALMEVPSIFVFTHDSISVGEDGPTHQPVEHLASLRIIPNLITLRPADANETASAWKIIMKQKHQPAALLLSRQNLPVIDNAKYQQQGSFEKGAYTIAGANIAEPAVLLLSSGSEVSLCLSVHEYLLKRGISSRVISMPSWELFEQQSAEYKTTILPPGITARVAVEQGIMMGWEKYTGTQGLTIGMTSFGLSAPMEDLQSHFGFTPEAVAEKVIGTFKL